MNNDNHDISLNIQNILNTVGDSSSYADLYDVYIKLNNLKINSLKNKLDNDVIDMISVINSNNLTKDLPNNVINDINLLRPYLKYVLSMISISYPDIHKNIPHIVNILNIVDQFNIHPNIFTSVFINLISNSIMIDLKRNIDIGYPLDDDKNKRLLNIVKNVPYDIDMLFNVYNQIIISHDEIFSSIDKKIAYNDINALNFYSFNDNLYKVLLNYGKSSPDILPSIDEKFKIMSTLISHIEHQTQNDLTEYMSNNIDFDTEEQYTDINNRFIFDHQSIEIFQKLYIEKSTQNLQHLKLYKQFQDFDIPLDINNLSLKSLYFWIDYIAMINSRLFDRFSKI
jgi:hypothetical protein